MPSLAAIEAYNQYLTQYSKPASSSKQDLHDSKKLRDVYGSIQKKNSQAPLYLHEPNQEEILSALILKDDVYSYHQDIAKLYANNPSDPFMQKFPYSNNEEIASVTLSNEDSEVALPQSLDITIESFATAQTNIGAFLPSTKNVILSNGNYSFDLHLKRYSYELQFDIYPDDTNIDLQNRIARLINRSNLSIRAGVIEDKENSALCLVSNAIGKPLKGDYHFGISDDNSTQTAGVVDYLGLNNKIAPPQNALIKYEGIEAESYDNTFKLYGRYDLKLHKPEDSYIELPANVEIGFYPDITSLTKNIEGFVDGYNTLNDELTQSNSNQIIRSLNNLVKGNREALEEFGITIQADRKLAFNQPEEWAGASPEVADTTKLTSLGNKILHTLQDAAVDPMYHINRQIGIYQNPVKKDTLNKPYVNYYSGLLFQKKI